MEVGWTCSLCRMEIAESFCCCGNSETLLCRKCLSTHFDKFPKRMHQKMPLAAYGHHKAPGYFDRLNARTQAIETGKEELTKQLLSTDRCLEEISTKINELYQRIWEAGQKAIEEVKQAQIILRETVQKSIDEAERTIYEDEPVLSEMYTEALRIFTGNFLVDLFQYEVKVCENVDSIFNVTFKTAVDEPVPPRRSKCIRCHRSNPMDNLRCDCGFVNQRPVGPPDPEVNPEPPPPQTFPSQPEVQNMCWACPCGYEYNLNTESNCSKCNNGRPGASSPAPAKPAPRYSLPVGPQSSTMYWECACGYKYNTASYCSQCNYGRSGTSQPAPAEPAPAEPAPRHSLPVKPQGSMICWACTCGYEYNIITSDNCLKCKNEKPGTKPLPAIFKLVPQLDSENIWTCQCGEENIGNEVCMNCPRRNPNLPPLNVCSKCGIQGSVEESGMCEMCEACEVMTVNSASPQQVWSCTKCGIQNQIGKPCSYCKRTSSFPDNQAKSKEVKPAEKFDLKDASQKSVDRRKALPAAQSSNQRHGAQDKKWKKGEKK